MIKKFCFILFLMPIICISTAKSQEIDTLKAENTSVQNEEKKPVEDAFGCTMLIDNQTIFTLRKKSIEFIIHHRIGQIKEASDLFGVYGPANIRLGINYGITDKLMLSFGTEKFNKMTDLTWKYSILQQQTKGMPVFLSYYGNIVVDGRDKSFFGDNYNFSNRLSYFHQLIIARKFSERISLQLAPYFLHFNKVDSLHANQGAGVSVSGRVYIGKDISFMAEYSYISPLETINYPKDAYGKYVLSAPKPGYSFGFEKSSGTHAFQLFATTYNNIIPQKNYLYNQRDFNSFVIGFNITVRF